MLNTFGKNILPDNEDERVKALHRYKLLRNLPENYFVHLAQIIAKTFNTPIALISLIDKEEVLFVGNSGMSETNTALRGVSLCSLAVLNTDVTIFEDSLKEPCLLANPLVVGEFGLRFYAGAPITTNDGYAIGTVCIVDKEPRSFTANEKEMLRDFAKTAMYEIEVRAKLLGGASD
jgi:GAF domain-containing protein